MALATKVIIRSLSVRAAKTAAVNNVTVIGCGFMGSGIAQRCETFIQGVMSNISVSTNTIDAVTNADMIVEAIYENMSVKKKLFTELNNADIKKSAVFASNTSSLSVGEMASVTGFPEKIGGLHFFCPVPVMKIVELVTHNMISQRTVDILMEFCTKLGKEIVKCKDTPGFIVNRLMVPYMLEACRMAERGDASFKDIDTAMKLGAGYKIGPFELADYIGLEVMEYVINSFHDSYPSDPLFRKSDLVHKLVCDGKLGRKTGEGFYKYNK
uniref:3-hydroxyacyl-CoA dehydrogenase n=1 Tax=Saccoglossus kowalevskii TaxID=10224 RepID=A0ABM0LUJ8_SACKO|nr:PREDICTED: hydroxyacyl-coenzyme A dehydrogenase, mitochondrial-like [Saccoglossus kowalevskii]